MGFLYVVGCHGMTKIGITTNLERRMRELNPDLIYQVFMSTEHEVLERDAHELYADKRLPQSEWFKLDKDDREELFGFLSDRSVPLTKGQTQGMVGEDMKDKVQDSVESKALKMAEERAKSAEEQVKSLEAIVKDQTRNLATAKEISAYQEKAKKEAHSEGFKEGLVSLLGFCLFVYVSWQVYRFHSWMFHFFP